MMYTPTPEQVKHLCAIADREGKIRAVEKPSDPQALNAWLCNLEVSDPSKAIGHIHIDGNSTIYIYGIEKSIVVCDVIVHVGKTMADESAAARKLAVFWARLFREPLAREAIRFMGSFPMPYL